MTAIRVMRYETGHGARVSIIGEPGRIYTRLVYIDSPIRLRKVANGDVAQFAREIIMGARTPVQAARRMLKIGKSLGIKKGAKKFLRDVISEAKT